jgi:hypothetical protein
VTEKKVTKKPTTKKKAAKKAASKKTAVKKQTLLCQIIIILQYNFFIVIYSHETGLNENNSGVSYLFINFKSFT